jgi:hypothetical protein
MLHFSAQGVTINYDDKFCILNEHQMVRETKRMCDLSILSDSLLFLVIIITVDYSSHLYSAEYSILLWFSTLFPLLPFNKC